MTDPTFGISITRVDEEPRPGIASDMSIVGLIGTAPAADAATFPLNTPVLIFSDDTTTLAKLGVASADNMLLDAIEGVNSQLGEFQVAARIVVVRVTKGGDTAATVANIVGSSVSKTGIWAFTLAGEELGVIPRLIIAPGYTSQALNSIGSVTITDGGQGFEVGDAITGTGGAGTGFAAEVATVDGDGSILTITITNPGTGYTSAPTLSAAGGTLATLAAVVDNYGNAVCAALSPVLEKLLAVAIVDGPTDTLSNWTSWRETIQSMRIIPNASGVKKLNAAGAIETRPYAPRVAGIGVRRDHEKQGRPFHSWANQPVQGIVGPQRTIAFSLTDGATEGQTILSQNGGILARGQMGVEQAIASGGFVHIGTDTCSEDVLWTFYSQVRGRDYIHLMFLRTLRFYLGRFNITQHTVQAILNTMTIALRDLQADGDILGFKVGFARDQNSPEQLRLGRFTVSFAAEEPAPLRYLGIQSARYRPALDALLDQLLAQLDTTVA
jgi:phage tail sheath protein FI